MRQSIKEGGSLSIFCGDKFNRLFPHTTELIRDASIFEERAVVVEDHGDCKIV